MFVHPLQTKPYERNRSNDRSACGDLLMATCTECGTENEEGAKYCVNCGAALGRMERRERRPRDECFGLPHGGAIFGLFIGAIIILWGLSQLAGWQIEIGTFAIIVIGLLIVAGAIYGLTKRR